MTALVSHIADTDISKGVVDCAFHVHKSVGPGLLENAYEECLSTLMAQKGIPFKKQVVMPLFFEGHKNAKMFKDGIKRFVL